MKKKNYSLFVLALVSLLISSCAIEKRMHLPGYSITKNTNISSKASPKSNAPADNALAFNDAEEEEEEEVRHEKSFEETQSNQVTPAKATPKTINSKKQTRITEEHNEDFVAVLDDEKTADLSQPVQGLSSSKATYTSSYENLKNTAKSKQKSSNNTKDDVMAIIIILLCIIIPPLAVYIIT
jgi:preprotein translocase subunit SecF